MVDAFVRPALPADAAAIAEIQYDVWHTQQQQWLPTEVLSLRSEDVRRAWETTLAVALPPRHHVFVGYEGPTIVGFCALSTPDSDEPNVTEHTLGLEPCLVSPRWRRRGHGSRLLAAAMDIATQDGADRATTWVLSADTASHDFLVAAGWLPDGCTRLLQTESGTIGEARLHTRLSQ